MSDEKKAWLYARVTSVSIADDNSLQQQGDSLHSFAANKGYTVVGETAEI